ncbi:MAG: hypothetical protein M3Z15_06300, partial [Pseudomonadota bacterium]|nr:hypothetical protein [Pseudomonadota bacterium]
MTPSKPRRSHPARSEGSRRGEEIGRSAQADEVSSLGKVAVLMGGTSAEREISILSGSGVLAALRSQGVDAHAFDPAGRDLAELRHEGFARC